MVVDRLEEGWVVCEDDAGNMVRIARAQCDGPIGEGDCLVVAAGRYRADPAATLARRRQIKQRYGGLWKKRDERQ